MWILLRQFLLCYEPTHYRVDCTTEHTANLIGEYNITLTSVNLKILASNTCTNEDEPWNYLHVPLVCLEKESLLAPLSNYHHYIGLNIEF